jgi:hypothetical protein
LNSKSKKLALFLIVALLLSSCAQAKTGAPQATQPPQPPTSTLPPTATQTPIPTGTEPPPTATLTPKPTKFVTVTPTPTATPPGMAQLKSILNQGASPDGKWLWAVEGNPDDPRPATHFVSADGSQSYTVQFSADETGQPPFDQAQYVPIFWPPQVPFVYLVGRSPSEIKFVYENGFRISRLNLQTGELVQVIPGNQLDSRYFTFSPRGEFLVEYQIGTHQLQVYILDTGKFKQINVPYNFIQVGAATWSADGDFVAFLACDDPLGNDCTQVPIFTINILTKEYKLVALNLLETLPDVETALHVSIAWPRMSRMTLTDAKTGKQWDVNTETGVVIAK